MNEKKRKNIKASKWKDKDERKKIRGNTQDKRSKRKTKSENKMWARNNKAKKYK